MRAPGRVRRWTIAVMAMAVGVLGIGALMPVHASSGDIGYLLSWELDGVERASGTWTTTTDLGYTVTVESGSITTFSVTMVACEHGHGWFGWLFGLLGPGVAGAGHSSDGDPALVGGPLTEDLADPATVALGTTTVDEPAYCEGHTAWGTVDPAEPTLTLTGTWVAPDGTTGDIALISTLDWGVGASLEDAFGDVHVDVGEPATIEVTRSLGTMFDGIDFSAADADDVAKGILRALADNTRFIVVDGVAHG